MKAKKKPTPQERLKSIEELILAYVLCAFDLLEDAVVLSKEREALLEEIKKQLP